MLSDRFQSRLINISKKIYRSANGKSKHISFLIRQGRILSIGVNDSWCTHPLAQKYGYRFSAIHSELACYLNSSRKTIKKCKMINIRINHEGNLAMAKPCIHCQAFLTSLGIKEIYYTNQIGNFTKL